jgi:hypothetical protein
VCVEDRTVFGSRLLWEQGHGDEGLADAPEPFSYCQIAQNAVAQFRFVGQLPQDVWWQNGANCFRSGLH